MCDRSLLTKTRDSKSADSIKRLGSSRQEEKKKIMSTKKPRKTPITRNPTKREGSRDQELRKNETRRTNRREDEKRKEPMTRNPMRCTPHNFFCRKPGASAGLRRERKKRAFEPAHFACIDHAHGPAGFHAWTCRLPGAAQRLVVKLQRDRVVSRHTAAARVRPLSRQPARTACGG